MFKTLTVSIGNSPFIIEEHAYATLERYLHAIRAHFKHSPDADEIVSDIESRMAEEFTEALGKKRKVIEMKDVEAVIATMGTVEDFEKFDPAPPSGFRRGGAGQEGPFLFKKIKLYRDPDNQIIAGVCAGIANYFEIDPLVVRLIFGLSLFMGGFGVLLYIIMWVIVPEARTKAEKVEMTGGRVTLAAIQEKIDAVMPKEKRKNMFAKIISVPFVVIGIVLRTLGKVVSTIFPLIGFLIGLAVTIGCALAIAGMTFVLLAVLLNPNSPYIGLPLYNTLGPAIFALLMVCGYFIAFVPVLFVLIVGSSLLARKNMFSAGGSIALGSLWLIAIVATGVTIFTVAPTLQPVITQYNETSQKSFDLKDFHEISTKGIDRIEVTHGPSYAVTLIGGKRGIDSREPVVQNGVLSMHAVQTPHDPCLIFCLSGFTTLHVTTPTMTAVTAADASRVTLTGFAGAPMTMNLSDIGYIESNSSFTDMTIHMQDASHLNLTGSANAATITAQDVSRLNGEEFVVQNANVTLQDVARVMLDVRQSLKGTAKDASRMEFMQQPTTVDFVTSDVASSTDNDENDDERY